MLKGKNAVITGARRGIGRATVEVFAKNGANVWACARQADVSFEHDVEELSERYGVEIWPLFFDVTDEIAIKHAVNSIRKQKKSIDILVNAAGIADESTTFPMTSIDKIRHTFEVNFIGSTILTQYISRLMIRQNFGSIVNISSVAAIDGEPAQFEYAASKAAIIGGTRNLARELSPHNVRVNAIAPGMTDTDMGSQIDDSLKERLLSQVMLRRVAKPEEIANAIAFLGSDLASYITGQIVRVDGGI